MKYYVYALSSEIKDWIYVGMTNNFKRRIEEHNRGYNRSTKPYKPFHTLFIEEYESTIEARNKEKYLKSAAGKRWIRKNYM